VVETGRRRHRSEDEKFKIVLESLQAPRQVSATAQRYGLSRSQLLQWRLSFRAEHKGVAAQQIGFVPAVVAPKSEAAVPAPAELAGGGAIELEFVSGARMRITRAVVQAALTAAVAALTEGRRRWGVRDQLDVAGLLRANRPSLQVRTSKGKARAGRAFPCTSD
jgi:transposase